MTAATTEPLQDERALDVTAEPAEPAADELVLADLLVEEISIDGMCGVY